jgi:hypothetical protein
VKEFHEDLHYSISVTSRPPRDGEVDGKSYHFVSREDFFARRTRGEFFEWEETHGNLYGTLRSSLENGINSGNDLLFQIDIRGAMTMKKNFPDIPVGYSGHEAGVTPSVIAVAKYGAVCVERHVTLDRAMWGSDQSASLEPQGMERVVKYIRSIPIICGTGSKSILEEEKPILEQTNLIFEERRSKFSEYPRWA